MTLASLVVLAVEVSKGRQRVGIAEGLSVGRCRRDRLDVHPHPQPAGLVHVLHVVALARSAPPRRTALVDALGPPPTAARGDHRAPDAAGSEAQLAGGNPL